jgi:cytochrome c1
MTRLRPPSIALALLLAVTLAAACGGSSSSGGSSAANRPATSQSASAEPPASEPAPSSANGSSSDAAFCSAAEARMKALRARIAQLFAGGVTPAGYAQALDLLREKFRETAAGAPDEIEPDLEVIADSIDKLAKVMESGGNNATAVAEAARLAESGRFKTAARHLSAWAKSHCPGVS